MTDRITALSGASVYPRSACDQADPAAARAGLHPERLHLSGRRESPGAIALAAERAFYGNRLHEWKLGRLGRARACAIHDHARGILDGAGANATAGVPRGDILKTVAWREHEWAFVLLETCGEAADPAILATAGGAETRVTSSRLETRAASRSREKPSAWC